ncbi:MAG: hypothetical protein AAGF11_43120 [Myxococcota bacterium]
MHKSITTAFALTAAALFVGCGKKPPTSPPEGADAAPASSDAASSDAADADTGPDVKCLGINECAGQGACDIAGAHDCGGQNECKGKGWILVSQSECETKGGEILES